MRVYCFFFFDLLFGSEPAFASKSELICPKYKLLLFLFAIAARLLLRRANYFLFCVMPDRTNSNRLVSIDELRKEILYSYTVLVYIEALFVAFLGVALFMSMFVYLSGTYGGLLVVFVNIWSPLVMLFLILNVSRLRQLNDYTYSSYYYHLVYMIVTVIGLFVNGIYAIKGFLFDSRNCAFVPTCVSFSWYMYGSCALCIALFILGIVKFVIVYIGSRKERRVYAALFSVFSRLRKRPRDDARQRKNRRQEDSMQQEDDDDDDDDDNDDNNSNNQEDV